MKNSLVSRLDLSILYSFLKNKIDEKIIKSYWILALQVLLIMKIFSLKQTICWILSRCVSLMQHDPSLLPELDENKLSPSNLEIYGRK